MWQLLQLLPRSKDLIHTFTQLSSKQGILTYYFFTRAYPIGEEVATSLKTSLDPSHPLKVAYNLQVLHEVILGQEKEAGEKGVDQ